MIKFLSVFKVHIFIFVVLLNGHFQNFFGFFLFKDYFLFFCLSPFFFCWGVTLFVRFSIFYILYFVSRIFWCGTLQVTISVKKNESVGSTFAASMFDKKESNCC